MGITPPAIDVTAAERRTVLALLKRHLPNTTVWAYGSRVKWTSRPESDLDLVAFARLEQSARVAELREAFEESDLPFSVDLFVWDEISESFRKRIKAEHVPLARDARRSGPGGWRETTLGNVMTLKRGYDLPQRERRPGSVPLVSSSGIIGHHSESKVSGPGVVTGRYGTLGQVFYIPEDFWPHNTALYVQDFKGNDPRFVSYLLGSLDFSSYSDKAAVPGLNRNHLHEAPVRIPGSIVEQRAIAHVLGTLDDRIELNRRMNATLEAMARGLFRSWFVDFDPVRAKMEGRDTGLPEEIARLFPDRLIDSELGRIPERWKVGHLSDVATAVRRGVSPADVAGDTPCIGLEHMPRRSVALSNWESAGKTTSNKSAFTKGDFLFGKLRPYFHKVGMAAVDGICSTDITVVKPKAVEWSGFTLAVISSDDFVAYADQTSTGTKMPRTSWKTMAEFRLVLPQPELAEQYERITRPVLDRIVTNIHESETHASMRDALLPMLVSGELRL